LLYMKQGRKISFGGGSDLYHERHSSRMLKKSASGILAALRGSTYRSIRLACFLAAALLDGILPGCSLLPDLWTNEVLACPHSFSQPARLMLFTM
jgi:hypothetical protein